MNIKIGMDAKRIVRNASGLGSYGRNLVNALTDSSDCPELVLYAPDEGRADLRSQVHVSERLRFAYSGKRWRLAQDLWRGKGIVRDLRRDGIGLYHGLTGELPQGVRRAGIKTVVTIHDLIFLRHPEYYHRLDVMLYRRKFYRTLREADRIIAISECTKRDILYYSDYPADCIDVIYQNCSSDFRCTAGDDERAAVRHRYSLPDHYILNVGTIEERKNVMLAVKALQQLPQEEQLVIVGRKTGYTNEVMEYAARHGVDDRIVLLHGVPNADLPALYQLADVFVYPSRYEGFGVPVIEAAQSGLPVVAATGSCLEEAGGPDNFYVDPDDADAMAADINRLLTDEDERRRVALKGSEYVRRFEGNRVAEQMLEEYRRVLGRMEFESCAMAVAVKSVI